MTAVPVARVLIDSPLPQLDRLFDYAIPAALSPQVVPGVRVKVPLRTAGRVVDALVVEVGEHVDPPRPLSELDAVVSPVRVLTPGLYALARRAADRAAGSAADVLRLAIPKRMVRAEKSRIAAGPAASPVVPDGAVTAARGILSAFPGLADAVTSGERVAVDAPPHPVAVGVTGETRTLGAWAQLIAAAAVETLANGRSAIVVVPDHRDQAQAVDALRAVLGAAADAVVEVDARQSAPERYAAFLRTLEAAPCIVVGNRSAVYAPTGDTGLVAIWDDGDALLSEPLSPGIHARDAALIRQEIDGCALMFVGHTRTTDVERLISVGWVRAIPAARRITPRVILSATHEGESHGARVPSAAFAAARAALAEGPVLVQVARPGYAPVLVCAGCRTPARCAHCAGPLHARRAGAAPQCTWCGRTANGWACGSCASTTVRMAASGSERTADELGRAFPGVRVIVADGEHQVLHVDHRPALVVATRGAEPIAEGGYRAVILLDADRMLLAQDLRIGESCLRWWSNAAALARRDAPVHLVGVAGPVARALATWSHAAYAQSELAERAALRMPPAVRVATLDGTAAAVGAAIETLRDTVERLPADSILGPVPRGEATRALVRFDYGAGAQIAHTLRAAVVAQALASRRGPKGRAPVARNTLKVRVDVPDMDL